MKQKKQKHARRNANVPNAAIRAAYPLAARQSGAMNAAPVSTS
jgi:hypothetical protein